MKGSQLIGQVFNVKLVRSFEIWYKDMDSWSLACDNSQLYDTPFQLVFKLALLQALNLKFQPITRRQNHLCLIIYWYDW